MFNVASSRDYYQKKKMKKLGENMMASVLYIPYNNIFSILLWKFNVVTHLIYNFTL